MIPNVIHFVYPAWPNTRPLSYLNYICIKRAIEIHKPDDVKFWIDGDPVENEWWQKIKPMVSIHRKEMRGEFGGTKIEWPQYQSDVTRLEILRDEGGIYLDTDVILMRDLNWVFDDDQFTISAEPSGNSLCNAVMFSRPNDPFVKLWLEAMPNALKSDRWANGGVITPFKLAMENGHICDVRDPEDFCPFDLHYPYVFEQRLNRATEALIRNSSALHIYETYWRDTIKNVTPEWVDQTDCVFSRIVKGEYD